MISLCCNKETCSCALLGRDLAIRTINETWIDNDDLDQYWHVLYDDNDILIEDLNLTVITTALQLYKLYLTAYFFPSDDPPAPTSNQSSTSKLRGATSTTASQSAISDLRGAIPLQNSKLSAVKKKTSTTTHVLTRLSITMILSSAVLQPVTPVSVTLTAPTEIASIFLTPIKSLPPDLPPHDSTEELRAYHSYLDRLNDMFLPDPEKKLWTPQTILSHHVRTLPTTNVCHVYMKILWSDHSSPRQPSA